MTVSVQAFEAYAERIVPFRAAYLAAMAEAEAVYAKSKEGSRRVLAYSQRVAVAELTLDRAKAKIKADVINL